MWQYCKRCFGIRNSCFPELIGHISSSNVHHYWCQFIKQKATCHDSNKWGKTKPNCKVTKVPMQFRYESSLISIGCIAWWRRLPNWAVLEAYWGIQDAHHNKMLMEDTKHCADRISIRGLLTVREREKAGCPSALIPPASFYTWEGGGGGGFSGEVGGRAAPSKFNICICLTTSQLLDEKRRSMARWRRVARRRAGLDSTLKADLTALHWNIHKVTSMEAQRQRPASDPCAEPPASTGTPAAL